MGIVYKNKSLQKVCTCLENAEKKYGMAMAQKIFMRIEQIKAAPSVEFLIQNHIGRAHPLRNNRKGQYALDLVHPYRLVFEVNGKEIQIAEIIEIVDYH